MWGILLSQGTQWNIVDIKCDNMPEQFTPGELGVNKQQTVVDLRHSGWNWFVTKLFLTSSLECLCISEVTTDSPSYIRVAGSANLQCYYMVTENKKSCFY